jgi:hypothetical protein
MGSDERDITTESGIRTTSDSAGEASEADGAIRLRVRVAGPPVFSQSVCSLLGDTSWINDVAPLTVRAGGTSSNATVSSYDTDLQNVDVLLVAVPDTSHLVRYLTESWEHGVRIPALALLTVGGHIFRSEMAVARRLGIRVFLSMRDGADTLRGGVQAAMRGEDYCSPDLRSLRKEITQLLSQGTETLETAAPPDTPPTAASSAASPMQN